MTKKILLVSMLIMTLALSSSVYASSANKERGEQASSSGSNGVHEPGTGLENPELKEENKGTGQGLQNNNSSSTTQNQEREKVQNREQIQKISVSDFVENILKIANKNGIGEQVKIIAQELNKSASTSIQAIEKVQTRSKIKTFLVGSDYKNLGELRSEIVQNRNRIEQLNDQLMNKINNISDQAELENQIENLKAEQTKIDNFIKEQEGKISLFGWLNKLINKE